MYSASILPCNDSSQRHEMLRAIMLPDGQQQILATVPPFEARIIDLRGKETQQVAAILQRIRQEMDHQQSPSNSGQHLISGSALR